MMVQPAPHNVPLTSYDEWVRFQLHVTHRCQLDCTYCDLDRAKPDLDEAMIARGLELCFASSLNKVDLQFIGGEPLLRFDLVRFATLYAEELAARTGKELRVSLPTNGLLLDERRARFVADHDIYVVLSVDGRPQLHARNRPLFHTRTGASTKPYPTHRILEGHRQLRELGVEFMLNMVVGPDDLPYAVDGVGYLVDELGAPEVRVSYRLGVLWSAEARAGFLEVLRESFDRFLDRTRFVNIAAGDEPTLAATTVNLDSDGLIYLGCALTTTKDMPSLLDTNLVGDLRDIRSFDAIDRDRTRQYRNLVSSPHLKPVDRDIIRNNLELGLAVDAFLREYVLEHHEKLGAELVERVLGKEDPEDAWVPRSPEEILGCLPEPDPARLGAARAAAVPGAVPYPFGVDAGEARLLSRTSPAGVLELPPGSADRLRERGFHLVPVPGLDGPVAASRDAARARRLAEVVASLRDGGDPELHADRARLIGAPPCCVEAVRARALLPTTLDRARLALAQVTPGGAPNPLLNVLDAAVLQLVPWLPCALDCAASVRTAARTLDVVRRLSPGFARRIEAELSAHRLVFHDLAQITVLGTWDGARLLVDRAWPTSRSHHPDSRVGDDAREVMARLAALVEAAREVSFSGEHVRLRGMDLGPVTATLFPFGGLSPRPPATVTGDVGQPAASK